MFKVEPNKPFIKAWLDPTKWSALVHSYFFILIISTLTEFLIITSDIFAAWMPLNHMGLPKEAEKTILLLSWLTVPFLLSQLITLAWLKLVCRNPKDNHSKEIKIAQKAIEHANLFQGIRRVPRILIGRIAQPVLVSIFGVSFIILPNQGMSYWTHYVPEDDERAFRSVISHEIGHLKGWDDVLFLPWFLYVISVVLICLVGFYFSYQGRLLFTIPLSHLIIATGLCWIGFYVIRRREAYADSFAVASLGSEKPIKLALQSLLNDPGANRGRIAIHFRIDQRLAWINERGRPFLDLSRTDLGLLTMIFFVVGTEFHRFFEPPPGWPSIFFHSISNISMLIMLTLSILTIAGMTIARQGIRPGAKEIIIAASIPALVQIFHSILLEGVWDLYEIIEIVFHMIRKSFGLVVPFLVFIYLIRIWTIGMMHKRDSAHHELLVKGALLLSSTYVILQVFTDLGISILVRMVPIDGSTIFQSKEEALVFTAKIFSVYALQFILLVAGMVAIILWSKRQTANRVNYCASCGYRISSIWPVRHLPLECPGCNAILREEFKFDAESQKVSPKVSYRWILILMLLLIFGTETLSSVSKKEFETSHRNWAKKKIERFGPIAVLPLDFDFKSKEPDSDENQIEGNATIWYDWKDADAQAEHGPVRMTLYWGRFPKRNWLRQASIHNFVISQFSETDNVTEVISLLQESQSIIPSLTVIADRSRNQSVINLFDRTDGTHWFYVAKIITPRCECHAISVVRTSYIPTEYPTRLASAFHFSSKPEIIEDEPCRELISTIFWTSTGIPIALCLIILLGLQDVKRQADRR